MFRVGEFVNCNSFYCCLLQKSKNKKVICNVHIKDDLGSVEAKQAKSEAQPEPADPEASPETANDFIGPALTADVQGWFDWSFCIVLNVKRAFIGGKRPRVCPFGMLYFLQYNYNIAFIIH